MRAFGALTALKSPSFLANSDENGEKSVHSRIGPVCLFIGNLKEGTTKEEVIEVVEPFGQIKKVDVKVLINEWCCIMMS